MPIIQPAEYAARRRRLCAQMGIGAIAIVASGDEQIRNGDSHFAFRPHSDFYYLTGFNEPSAIMVLLPERAQGEYILFSPPSNPLMETWHGRRAGQQGAVQLFGADEAYSNDDFVEMLPELLCEIKRVFFLIGQQKFLDDLIFSGVSDLRKKVRAGHVTPTEFINLEGCLHELRLRKSPAEIEVMRKAATISAAGHRRAMEKCRAGLFEYELEAEMRHEFCKHGSKAPAYNFIVGGGANACILHYSENDAPLREGELVLIDAACEYENYAADITRTFPISGLFTAEQRAIYEVVLQAQLAVIALVRPGLRWHELHDLGARKITEGLVNLGLLQGEIEKLIATKAYTKFYMHSTGHWLGMDVHDAGAYKKDGEWRFLEPGMVFTVEPGIYISPAQDVPEKWWNIGIRIEDDIVVTEDGCEVLSSTVPKRIEEIEALMAQR